MYFINREYPLLSLQRVCERASLSTHVRTLIYGGGAHMIILFHIFGYTGAGSHKHTILILPDKGPPNAPSAQPAILREPFVVCLGESESSSPVILDHLLNEALFL